MTVIKKAGKLSRAVSTFFISSVTIDGYPVTTAVSPCKYQGSIRAFYFWTNTSFEFVKAYSQRLFTDPAFCVVKFIPTAGRYYEWFKPHFSFKNKGSV